MTLCHRKKKKNLTCDLSTQLKGPGNMYQYLLVTMFLSVNSGPHLQLASKNDIEPEALNSRNKMSHLGSIKRTLNIWVRW